MNLLKRKQEMEEYAKLHKLEACKNYGHNKDEIIDDNKIKLASYIHNNFSDDTEPNTMKDTLLKCMTIKQMKKILYEYELKYYKLKDQGTSSLEEFKEQAEKIIKRYQWKGGGYYIEDIEWTVYTHATSDGFQNNSTYTVKDNQILFENSVHNLNAHDNDTINYMNRLVSRLNNLASNIEVEYEFYNNDEIKDITWILLWGTDNNIVDNEPNID